MKVAAAVFSLCLIVQASAQPQQPALTPTSFTYQGELRSLGVAANGLHDMRFRLYEAANNNNPPQLGPTLCVDNITVTDGKFTATLDFGAQFTGAEARLLEVEVRPDIGLTCSNLAGFTVLAPRQQVTSTPRATSALVATTALSATVATALVRPNGSGTGVVNVTNAGNVGVGTAAPVAKLHVAAGDIVAGASGEEWMIHTRASFGGDFLQITDADNGAFQFQRGLFVHENGSVGIGAIPDGGRKLFVNGQIGFPPVFRTKTIAGVSFLPDIVGSDSGAFGRYDPSGMEGFFGNFIVQVELPNGCQVHRIDLTYVDSRPSDFTLTFGRTSTTTGVVSNITSVTTSGQNTNVRLAGVDLAGFSIGNNSNVYWLSANLNSFGAEIHKIIAVRIQYTVTSPLP